MPAFDPLRATDAALVVAIGRWREDALAEVYRRHAGSVFALASRILTDRARAEDITQEIFLKLWDDPTAFDPDRGSLRSYLSTQAHSRSVDMIRSDSSRRRREENDASQIDSMIDSLEREVIDLSVAEDVKTAFETLPANERNAIELAYYKGHTYREVATLLNEPEGTIKSRIRSGLRRLRDQLPASVTES